MEIISLSTTSLEEAVSKATLVLQAGGIVLYPTDTVYGLAVDASNLQALKCLYALKGRERGKPVSILVPSIEVMSEYIVWSEEAQRLAHAHLPGPLTLLLPARTGVLTGLQHDGLLGIRVPHDEFALGLAISFGRAYTSTSANISGQPTLDTVEKIVMQFENRTAEIDLAIDAGTRSMNKPSTIVGFTDNIPYIIREGALPRNELGI